MYASQTKRLCVRGAPSDETRVQHQHSTASSSSTEATTTTTTTNNQQILSCPTTSIVSNRLPVDNNMNASESSTTNHLGDVSNNQQSSTTPLDGAALPFVQNNNNNNIINSNNHSTNNTTSAALTAAANAAIANLSGESEHDLITRLASETLEETKLELILSIRNLITACNKKKNSIANHPNFNKIIELIDDDKSNSTLVRAQLALLLCSIAKGGEQNVKVLNGFSVDDKILNIILNSQEEFLIEACLRCLRSMMSCPKVSRTWLIYDNNNNNDQININNKKDTETVLNGKGNKNTNNKLLRIITYAKESNSFIIQECVADIFAATCNHNKDQLMLHEASALSCIIQLLESSSYRVIISTLNWLTQFCLKNQEISQIIIRTKCPSGTSVLDRLSFLMNKDKYHELQFLAARCFSHLYRASNDDLIREDFRIISQVLPTLVRMVHKDKPASLRIKSAECIAYLIESETPLQNTASFCDHLIDSLADMLDYENDSNNSNYKYCNHAPFKSRAINYRGISWLSITPAQPNLPPALDLRPLSQIETSKTIIESLNDSNDSSDNNDITGNNSELNQEMKRAAFLALASLASNLEPIRTKIYNTCSVMQNLVRSLTDSDTKTLRSVLRCLLSLSRSVHQLRTSFAENDVYSSLKSLLSTTSNDVLKSVLEILCNIIIEFSPGKQNFLDSNTIEILSNFTHSSDSEFRYYGMWALMNMVFHMKDLNLKFQILQSLNINHLLGLLESEKDEEIVMKSLGLLRNLLCEQLHIDAIMKQHGKQIMQSLVLLLEKPYSLRIKEQTLCVLTNIAVGIDSKAFIMKSETIMNYITRLINDEQGGNLRLAAIGCITNLVNKDSVGSYERRDELKKYGIEEKLKSMLNTSDRDLSNQVSNAYKHFIIGNVN